MLWKSLIGPPNH